MIKTFQISYDGLDFRITCDIMGEEVKYLLEDLVFSFKISEKLITLDELAEANHATKDAEGRYWVDEQGLKNVMFAVSMRGSSYPKAFKKWLDDEIAEYKAQVASLPAIQPMAHILQYFGQPIEINEEGMWNATQMASIYGKQTCHWLESKNTQNLINRIASNLGIPRFALIQVVNGGIGVPNRGTWIHQKLVVEFARWLNVDLAIWCNDQIETLLREGYVQLQAQNNARQHPESIKDWALRCIQQEEEKERLAQRFEDAQKKAVYLDAVTCSDNLYTATVISKELGFRSVTQFNQELHNRGVQFKQGDHWVLYAQFQGKGYTVMKSDCGEKNGTGYVGTTMKWTEEGRKFLHNLFQK